MSVTPAVLREIAYDVLDKLKGLSDDEFEKMLTLREYHGFQKAALPNSFLKSTLRPLGLAKGDVSVEIIEGDANISSEAHFHKDAYLCCVCLGNDIPGKASKEVKALLGDTWFDIDAYDIAEIPPGLPHGFSVGKNGHLAVLLVETSPIRANGKEDYVKYLPL